MIRHNPKDVIDPIWLETYEQQREAILKQLIDLNYNVFLLEKISHFPFHLFLYATDSRHFWQRTTNALIDSSILIIWKTALDKDRAALTLNSFKENILAHLVCEEAKNDLNTALQRVEFDKQIANTKKKIEFARHNYVAHLNAKLTTDLDNPERQKLALSLPDLKELLETLRRLFDLLCFSQKYSLWLVGELDADRAYGRTDIDRLLDMLAEHSNLLNMPERKPEVWKLRLEKLSESDLKTLNDYREKFGLPRVLRN